MLGTRSTRTYFWTYYILGTFDTSTRRCQVAVVNDDLELKSRICKYNKLAS